VTVAAEGRRLLRLEVRNAETPIERKPPWIKTRLRTGPQYTELKGLVQDEGLHTVCEEAGCPNIFECWEDREATFLIGGDQCTRRCDFCQIDTGKPAPLDRDEPRRVAESVQTMGLRYATITGVTRDDLDDEGAWLYAQTVRAIHELNPGTGVELLTPDFSGRPELLAQVFDAAPEVFAHNLETVPRIFRRIRPGFRYERSLEVIAAGRAAGMVTKSNLILGMGETRAEAVAALAAVSGDLSAVETMRTAFDRRRKTIVGLLSDIPGIVCPEPQGAFYVYPSVKGLLGKSLRGRVSHSSAELAAVILDEAEVAVVPGEAFGTPGYMRLSYALGDDDLAEGVGRIAKLVADAG